MQGQSGRGMHQHKIVISLQSEQYVRSSDAHQPWSYCWSAPRTTRIACNTQRDFQWNSHFDSPAASKWLIIDYSSAVSCEQHLISSQREKYVSVPQMLWTSDYYPFFSQEFSRRGNRILFTPRLRNIPLFVNKNRIGTSIEHLRTISYYFFFSAWRTQLRNMCWSKAEDPIPGDAFQTPGVPIYHCRRDGSYLGRSVDDTTVVKQPLLRKTNI